MDKTLFNILNYINEGIIITDEELEILFWNDCMENITGINQEKVINSSIYNIVPSLNRDYFKEAMKSVIENDHKFFFSSSMHRGLISEDIEINLRLSRFEHGDLNYLIIECIDVTSQIIRINQLKEYNKKLSSLNKELKEKEKEIEKLAYYDRLTGLANRTLFYNVAEKFLEDSKRNNKKLGLMFIDIDRFKRINDMYGHKVGDKVLAEVANILIKSTRKNDIVSRHGGDEFLILLPDIKDYNNYRTIASRIANANKKIKINDDIEIDLSLSIGVSFYPKDGDNIDQLISKADKAMYCVKSKGGNECAHYFVI